jgi:hypothetical protein
MCSKPKFIEDAQRAADSAIDQIQSAADSAVNQATGNTSSSSGGKGAPVTTPVFNMPSYGGISGNFDFNIPTPNLDQDLAAPVVEAIQDVNVPRPNTDQDLTRISVQGLQESAVEQGTQLQQEAINTGTKIQETVVQAGSNLQEAAVQAGASISGGQSNPTLENAAEQVTTYIEDKAVPFVRDLYATAYGDKGPITLYQEAVHDFEKNTPGIEALGNLDASLNSSDDGYSSSTTQLSADTPNLGDDQVFSDLETATGRGSQMSEEERLRRIRRLLTNRYGREKTILGGAGDTTSRRRYAV